MNIEALLATGEGKIMEFKQNLSSPKGLLKTIAAFANTAGGKIIIGIDDVTRQTDRKTGCMSVSVQPTVRQTGN